MRSNNLLLAAFATASATAQDLATVLSGQESLSTLVGLLGQVQNTTDFLASQEKVTLFAPSNDAFASIVAEGGIFSIEQAAADPELIEQILRYHLSQGVVKAADIKEIPQFLSSYLDYSGFVLDGEVSGSNVTGGQVVSVNLNEEGNAIVTSGIKATSQVVVKSRKCSPNPSFPSGSRLSARLTRRTQDIEFDNGIIHIIDKLLLIPLSISATLIAGNFTALAGAATSSQTWSNPCRRRLSDVTIFCPNNDAFQKLAGTGSQLLCHRRSSWPRSCSTTSFKAPSATARLSANDLKLPTLNGRRNSTITIERGRRECSSTMPVSSTPTS